MAAVAPPASTASPAWFDLRGHWRGWWEARLQPTESQTLTQRNIYIVPTRAGIGFAATLLLLLVASINYQLSLGFALTFLLAGSAAASMHMTHGSLRGLTLHMKATQPAFAGDAAVLEVVVTNPGASRLGVGFALETGARPRALSYTEIGAAGQTSVRLAWLAPGRGRHAVPLVRAETRYPFGLFRAWTVWRPAAELWVYPRPETPMPAWPSASAAHDEHRPVIPVGAGTEFDGVRAYRRGDTLRQIVWKKAAHTGELVSRESAGGVQREMWLQWSQTQAGDAEARLSRLAAWVIGADAAGQVYGLRLPGVEIAPSHGAGHRHAALRALAVA
jgi:uncharacterized protein (DUF58 family)